MHEKEIAQAKSVKKLAKKLKGLSLNTDGPKSALENDNESDSEFSDEMGNQSSEFFFLAFDSIWIFEFSTFFYIQRNSSFHRGMNTRTANISPPKTSGIGLMIQMMRSISSWILIRSKFKEKILCIIYRSWVLYNQRQKIWKIFYPNMIPNNFWFFFFYFRYEVGE